MRSLSGTAVVVAIVLLVFVGVAIDRARDTGPTPREEFAVVLPSDGVREPNATTPTCDTPDGRRRQCVIAERAVFRAVAVGIATDPATPSRPTPETAAWVVGGRRLVTSDDRMEVVDGTGTVLVTFRALAPRVVSVDPLVVEGNGLLYLLDASDLGLP